jgi:hypothetical protein
MDEDWSILDSQEPPPRVDMQGWADLQLALQQEYHMLVSESQQVDGLHSRLAEGHIAYYDCKLAILNLQPNQDTLLVKDDAKALGNNYSFCKEALLRFAGNPRFGAQLVSLLPPTPPNKKLCKAIALHCYENLVEERATLQPILALMGDVLQRLLGRTDREGSLEAMMLHSFFCRPEYRKYSQSLMQPLKRELLQLDEEVTLRERTGPLVKLNLPVETSEEPDLAGLDSVERYAKLLRWRDRQVYGHTGRTCSRMLLKRLGLDSDSNLP